MKYVVLYFNVNYFSVKDDEKAKFISLAFLVGDPSGTLFDQITEDEEDVNLIEELEDILEGSAVDFCGDDQLVWGGSVYEIDLGTNPEKLPLLRNAAEHLHTWFKNYTIVGSIVETHGFEDNIEELTHIGLNL